MPEDVTQHVPAEITLLLRRLSSGETDARGRLVDLMYPDLKRLAEARMRAERNDHTLQATALVGEFFLEIARAGGMSWRDRTHFLAVASQAMRRFLIDYARRRSAERRGGGRRVAVQIELLDLAEHPCEMALIGELLEQLEAEDARLAQVVDMRCFGGLTHTEIGDALGIDERTVKRDWRVAKAWLGARLHQRAATNDA